MKIDITSLCFGFKIEKDNDSGTAAWATSIGQAPKDICYIDTNREGLDEIVYGMMYKSHSDFENLKVREVIGLDKREEPRGDRERMMFSVFEDVYVNNMKVDGIYTLTYEREDTPSHKNRLHICYAKYLTYNGHSNKETLKEMAKKLGCNEDGCWFVTDITIRNQKNLHFTAIVVNPKHSMTYLNSKERKRAWEELIPEEGNNNHNQIDGPLQQIFYGAPGTGKSHEVKKRTGEFSDNGEDRDLPNVFRTTFHPDTDYASFVGCYKPSMRKTGKKHQVDGKDVDDEEIIYEFVPQTFTDAYVYAYKNPSEPAYLVIEEINRGNCAQIFGDLFQLLDRKNGVSEYRIKADKDLAKFLIEELGQDADGIKDSKLRLPANLNILATMNTSDQSLFPIDSAFKRRWEWKYTPIAQGRDKNGNLMKWQIEGQGEDSWWTFIQGINEVIDVTTHSEDKKLGFFFCKDQDGVIKKETFVNKVVFYLWNDVFKVYGFKSEIFDKKGKDDKTEKITFKSFYKDDGSVNEDTMSVFVKNVMAKAPKENSSNDDPNESEEITEESETEA